MTNHELARELVERYKGVANKLVEIVGNKPLPEAKSVRKDTDVPKDYTPGDIVALQEALGELGFGRSTDLSPGEAGMQDGYVAVLQGGLERKIDAEWEAVVSGAIKPGAVIQTASIYRIVNDEEHEKAATKGMILDEGATEYDLALAIAQKRLGEDAHKEPLPVDFHYDPAKGQEGYIYDLDNNKGEEKPTVVEVGMMDGVPVYLMQTLRAYNEVGKYKQPKTIDLAVHGADLIKRASGDYPSYMANVGSSTYPSLDIAPSGNATFSSRGVPTVLGDVKYGTRTLANVDGTPEASPSPANTLSEVDRLIKMAAKL